jgi:hypothetical protein
VFDFLKKTNPKVLPIRDTLFGDIPLTDWTNLSPSALETEPWSSFLCARRYLEAGDSTRAVEVLRNITVMSGLESRQYLQAWQSLRELGTNPPAADAKNLLGVVVEVGMPNGIDLVAAYADFHARYYNHSGAGVIWELPNTSLNNRIDDVLQAGTVAVQAIGPWKGKRPAAAANGIARINLLTPSGIHFGEGPMEALAMDKLGGPVINAALQLMLALMQTTQE